MAFIVQEDTTANDSDKTFTVPAGAFWRPVTIYVSNVSSGTAGTRVIQILFTDASDNRLYAVRSTSSQAASLTYEYIAGQGIAAATVNSANQVFIPLPQGVWLGPGCKIRIYDVTAVDAAADDMTIRMIVDSQNLG